MLAKQRETHNYSVLHNRIQLTSLIEARVRGSIFIDHAAEGDPTGAVFWRKEIDKYLSEQGLILIIETAEKHVT
jgi:hypothetical protein